MSVSQALRLGGAKYRREKTGIVTIQEGFEVQTIEDCENFKPNMFPLGLPIVERSATEFEVGTWELWLTYGGTPAEDGDVNFASADKIEVELDTSMSQDPIQSHPNFDALKLKYGWDTAKEQFAATLPQTDKSGALSGAKKSKRNPLHGTDSYLAVGAIFRLSFAGRHAPPDLLEDVGCVIARPPGWNLLGITHPRNRNWLKLAPKVRIVGNSTRFSPEWMLSGPNGWMRDIYGAQQLTV